ncbi:PREDICTED: acyl-CoA Delta(11) desaturase-like [Dinoponera quadriceps]|uniref:Acyl-CoA Delta(11) desaturase-like n=1 Tax=Dinoponera quadriceps TaxID=609295 RepID=A0A6P3Y7L5_DINQU|nr:PREDICTED: acyl-CoA Delta(11) desaturase-like [Dinoponera quadriceps]
MYSSTITEYEDGKDRKSAQTANDTILHQPPKEHIPAKQPLIWRNIIGIAVLHVASLYMFAKYYQDAKFWTWIYYAINGHLAGIGITAGAHRLWAHRSYSAKLPLKILLVFLYCMAGMTHLYKWIRVHRTHHRYTDTSADPHNAKRGFFFSHVGWLMMKHHPAVKEYGKHVDMSDILADPVIRFVDKYYEAIMLPLCFILPPMIPVYAWNETWTISIGGMFIRYIWLLNATFSVNSVAHIFGNRPYNRSIEATENYAVSVFSIGEGWHNYHHCFPWDYRASEYGRLNLTTHFINLMAWLGWAYDLKTPNDEIVNRFCTDKGDGTPCPATKRQPRVGG